MVWLGPFEWRNTLYNRLINRSLAAFVVACSAAFAPAAILETVTFTNVNSNGPLNNAVNDVRNFASAGGYSLGKVNVSGTLRKVNSGTFASEAKIKITGPSTATATLNPFPDSAFPGPGGTRAYTGSFMLDPTSNPVGNWNFRFYESFDDGGTGAVDAIWDSITFDYTDELPNPPPATSLGSIFDTTGDYLTPDRMVSHNDGGVQWYKFRLEQGISAGAGTFLDIDTEGSTIDGLDTEIGLYNAAGQRLADDDDDGTGFLSELSWGQTGPRPIGGAVGGNGRDGSLAAGIYYLAVGGFNTNFGDAFNVTTDSTDLGGVTVNFRTNAVPEPGTMLALAAGLGFVVARRRRK